MKSSVVGKNTSQAEVTNVSPFGIWILVQNQEYFLPYEEFPWFKEATIASIIDVKLIHGHHLHWPGLDVDIELESLNQLENYPLFYIE